MSTRATYEIDGHTFYIHCDGYPEFASVYFLNAINKAGGNYQFAENFLRANEKASFTASHDAHGDTEYKYTYNSETNELSFSNRGYDSDYEWSVPHATKLEDFINSYIEHYAYQYAPETVYQGLKTERQLLKDLNETASYLKQFGPDGKFIGNLSSSYDSYRDQLVALNSYIDNDVYQSASELMIHAAKTIRKCFQINDKELCTVTAKQAWDQASQVICVIESQLKLLETEREVNYQQSLKQLKAA